MKNFNDLRQELNERGVTSAVASKFELPKEPAKTNPIVAKPSASTGGPNLPKSSTVSTGYSSGGPIMKRPATSVEPYTVPNQSPGIKDVTGKTIRNTVPKITSSPTTKTISPIGSKIMPNIIAAGLGAAASVGVKKALNVVGPDNNYSDIAGINARQKVRDSKITDTNKSFTPNYGSPILKSLPKVGATATDKLNTALRGDEPIQQRRFDTAPVSQNKGPQNNNGGVITPKSVQAVKPSKPEPAPAIKKAEEITKVNKPTNPLYGIKRQALDKVYDPNAPDSQNKVGVTAKAYTQNDGAKTSFYNLNRGTPSEPRNFTKLPNVVANPNLQNQIQNVAKSEFKPGAIKSQFPANAKFPDMGGMSTAAGQRLPPQGTQAMDQALAKQGFKKFGPNESLDSVIEFLNKKSSWNRSNKVEILENIKEDMISIFNTLTESKYTNEVLERELNTLKTKYSLTEDQLEYLISRFLDEGLLGGIAKWVGLPALGFLAATYGKDIINNIKTSHGSEKPTEISQTVSQPVKSEPVSQKELTPVKKPDTLSSKLKAVSDVSKSATTAADQTTDLMKKASEKLDKMMKK